MANAVMIVAGLLGLVTCALKAGSALRHPERPASRALCVMLGVFGLAFIVTAPAVTPRVSAALGIVNGGRLVGNALTLVSGAALQAMMLYLAHRPEDARPRVRIRLVALAVAVAGMSVSLSVAHTVETTDFLSVYASYPPVMVYQLFYLSFLGLAIADLLYLSIRYSRYAEGALRWGLRVVATGAVAGVAYFGYKLLLLIAGWVGTSPPGSESNISTLLAGTAGILVAIGATMPLWWRYVEVPWHRARQYLAYRRLAPLWRALLAAVPEVALAAGDAMTGDFRRWQIRIRLYRRVIEIRDAQLVLRAYCDPLAVRQAEEDGRHQGLAGDRLRALIDAAVLVTALQAVGAGKRSGTATATRPATEVGTDTEALAGDASLASESRYLEMVAAAFNSFRPTLPSPSKAET
ncbi:hypothetical protein HC031_13125 [Planosporangium thailandense]|uniref:DUF6545 domain-containing protein n=1 Tax=Planosporangium thailandense TaxID=765197 RepID=A0ABX0XZI2_9ACTN|nr:MAB_1171c family putative transporter [Planosporangium thailandense]NJC70647.1 hypothetical protein [Planosporangium thailandense]